jgi:hypothetical protein
LQPGKPFAILLHGHSLERLEKWITARDRVATTKTL